MPYTGTSFGSLGTLDDSGENGILKKGRPPVEKLPRLPRYNQLTSLQVTVAREVAKGRKVEDIRRQFGISQGEWSAWARDPRFVKAIEDRTERMDQLVEEALAEGEAQAAHTLVLALRAQKPLAAFGGKAKNAPRFHPDWEVRLKAAMTLLDRRGQRGTPVERSQQATFNYSGDVAKQLIAALADPAVRDFIAKDAEFAARFRQELAQLPAGEEVPPCDDLPASEPPS